MRKALNFTLACFSGLCFFSCKYTQMQVVSLESDKLAKNDSLWVYSDSIVDIWFYFYTNHGGDHVFIQNKSSRPVFFDLKNSFVAVDNQKKDLWTDVAQVDANLQAQVYHPLSVWTNNPISGSISRQSRVVMIPPNSIDNLRTSMNLHTTMFNLAAYGPKTETVSANWHKKNPGRAGGKEKTTVVKSASFARAGSPSQARFFFTFARTEDFKNPLYYDLNFWVSAIEEMDARQVTGSVFPEDHSKGFYTFGEKDPNKATKHPYKKSWRYYIPEK